MIWKYIQLIITNGLALLSIPPRGSKKRPSWNVNCNNFSLANLQKEEQMKRTIILAILVNIAALLSASGLQLSVLTAEKGIDPLKWVKSPQRTDATIYYYNDEYIIAALDPAVYPDFEYLGMPAGREKLYLIESPDSLERIKIQTLGSIHQLPNGDMLLFSEVGEVKLRSECSSQFINLLLNPITVQDSDFGYPEVLEYRTELAQLSQMVSADSVEAFIQSLQDMQTRYALADNRLEVANWIKNTFQRFGISNAHLQEFTWNDTQQYNVVATIEGTMFPDEYVVVGGHHDSITYTNPLAFAPGADDNASGVAAALETARVLVQANYQPKCSIRFVTFAAEEFGLYGSHFSAQNSVDMGENIRLMVNHDMIANNPDNLDTVRLMPYDGNLAQSEYASMLVSEYSSLSANFGNLNSSSSDSFSYWSRGYPVIYFYEQDFSPVYHSNEDVVANLNPAYCAEVIKGSLVSTVSFANMPKVVSGLEVRDYGDGNSLLVSWQEPLDSDIDHVMLHVSTGDPEQSEAIAVYDADSYVVTGLVEGQMYNVMVYTVDTSGNDSYRQYSSGVPFSSPMAPQDFTASPIPDAVRLNWRTNQECDLAGYSIYRSTDFGASFSLLTTADASDSTYIDTDVFGSVEQYYYYQMQAIDNDGNASEYGSQSISRPVSLDQGILIVDESSDGSGSNPFQPTDEMVDQYYANAMDGFDHDTLDIITLDRDLSLYDICVYSTVVWHNTDLYDASSPYYIREVIRDYIAFGGKLLYTGYNPTKAFELNAGYPVYFDADSYINSVLGISGANFSTLARFSGAISQVDQFGDFTIDPDKTFEFLEDHITRVEALYPAPGAQVWYTYATEYEQNSAYGEYEGLAVAVYHEYGEGKSAVFSFPIYAANQGDQLQQILTVGFGESVSNDDALAPVSPALQIAAIYPNPFTKSTRLVVKGSDEKQISDMKIYNLRGQLVRSLGATKSGEYDWDGKDDNGQTIGSGIYFARIRQQGRTAQRKLLRLK
jgi:hypothetical protein